MTDAKSQTTAYSIQCTEFPQLMKHYCSSLTQHQNKSKANVSFTIMLP